MMKVAEILILRFLQGYFPFSFVTSTAYCFLTSVGSFLLRRVSSPQAHYYDFSVFLQTLIIDPNHLQSAYFKVRLM